MHGVFFFKLNGQLLVRVGLRLLWQADTRSLESIKEVIIGHEEDPVVLVVAAIGFTEFIGPLV